MPFFQITDVDGRKSDQPIDKDEMTLGRNQENDIVLDDSIISRVHAKVFREGREYFLKDLGSYNGTIVNGKLIQVTGLKDNDEIRIGNTRLTFHQEETIPISTDGRIPGTEALPEDWEQNTIVSIPDVSCEQDSHSLLSSISHVKTSGIKIRQRMPSQEEIISLERMNKVLFILYEVSRQLTSLSEFHELLQKIMDLIFVVIDADYGFLVLVGEEDPENLVPVVVKSREDKKHKTKDMTFSRTIINKVIQERVALLTSNAMEDSRLAAAQSIIRKRIVSAICVPLWDKDKIIGAIQLNSTRAGNLLEREDLELLKTIGCQLSMVIAQARLNKQIREEEEMRQRLERFHSPQVIEMILKRGQESTDNIMAPKELSATILFTDIIGFTSLAESMPPREVNLLLNRHFSRMTDVIFKHDGTLDKYIGDGLMAVFGAPVEKDSDAERAVQAALKMRDEVVNMAEHESLGLKFDLRFGINSGRVVAGNIGSPQRMDYTVIGDPVNTARRLENIAKPNQILIGEETYKLVKNKFKINEVGLKKLRGKKTEIVAYEVLE